MKRWFWLLAATTPIAFIASVTWYGAFTFANAYMIRGLGASNAQWTRATLAMSGGMLVWYLFTVEMSALLGRRQTATLGTSIAALAYISLPFAHEVWMVSVLLALMGFGTAGYLVAWLPYVTHVGGNRPGRALTMASISYNLISGIAIFALGPALQAAHFHFVFFLTGGACLGCLVLFYFAARHLEAQADTSAAEENQPARPTDPLSLLKLQWHDVRELVRSAFPIVLLLGICAAPFAFHTSNQLYPNLMRDIHHLQEDAIARLVAVGRVPAMLTLFLMSPIIDRLNLVRFYGLFLFTDGLLIAAIALAQSTLMAGTAYLVFYLSHGFVWAFALPAINVCVRPRLRDSAFALTAMFEILGVFFAGMLHNRLLEAGCSLPCVFVVCGVVAGLSGLLLLCYSFSGHSRRNGRPAI
ncbi:MAG TPA: MFS transporter [Candidatus Hydrogenedentes bacterium]|jgi:MFS family permease|nr:MFS transporter [Candidatus Hydrogenedentota bacterium]HPJ99457.1 MFS transporter [Candidatus Hydrogenedentota bacterium]